MLDAMRGRPRDFTRFSSRFVQQLPTVIKVPEDKAEAKKGGIGGMRKLDSPRLLIAVIGLYSSLHIITHPKTLRL